MEENRACPVLDRLLQATGLRRDKQLAQLLGVSPQAVSQARRKDRVPDRWLVQVAEQFHVSSQWLSKGMGSPISSRSEAPASTQHSATRYIEYTAPTPEEPKVEMALVPLVEASLAAGTGSLENGGQVQGYFAFRQDWLLRKGNPDRMVLMKVFGDSMEPEIRHGDMVLVDQSRTQIFGHAVYAVGVNDEIYIKQVETRPGGTLVLRSYNSRYEPIEVSLHEDLAESVRIIGRIIWWCREA